MMKNDPSKNLHNLFSEIKPYKKKPGTKITEKTHELVKFIGLVPGQLYTTKNSSVWICGNVEDPIWLGNRHAQDITVVAKEPFLFIGLKLLKWIDTEESGCNWLWFLYALVEGNPGYFPIPPLLLDEYYYHVKEDFKEYFVAENVRNC